MIAPGEAEASAQQLMFFFCHPKGLAAQRLLRRNKKVDQGPQVSNMYCSCQGGQPSQPQAHLVGGVPAPLENINHLG